MRQVDRKCALKKKQDENEQLESETRRMEERLCMLKSVLNKDLNKLPTNNGSSEYIWAGSIPKERSKSTVKVNRIFNLETVKLRTLQRGRKSFQPVSDDMYKNIINKLTNECSGNPKGDSSNKVHMEQIRCGQCEVKCAAVSCQECNEDYCAKCFARFHIKGAMKRHHSLPLSCYSTRPLPALSLENKLLDNQLDGDNPHEDRTTSNSDCFEPGKETCDFQAQSRSPFTQVMCTAQTEGRHTDGLSRRPMVSTTSRGTSSERAPSPMITFSPSLTYAERLMLRKHRRSQTSPMLTEDANNHAAARLPSKDDEIGDESDLDVTCTQIDFNQLHTLATTPFKREDLVHLCYVEDLETMENVVTTVPLTAECKSPKEVDQKNVTVNGEPNLAQDTSSENHADLNQQQDCKSLDMVSKYLAPSLDTAAAQETKPVTCWPVKASLQQSPALIQNELKTIELIKRHLNKLTITEQFSVDNMDGQPT